MNDLGLLHYFLGFEIKYYSQGLFISQEKYSMDRLQKFNMLDCKPSNTPVHLINQLQQEF